jgi:phenylacetic acid degradation operon negative regulatory protein
VERAWPLDEIESRYGRFINTYSGTLGSLERGIRFTDLDALLVRILLIHDFRRAVLKDPLLAPQLLPTPWAGTAARALCGTIYRTLLPAAEHWIDTHARNNNGRLPIAEHSFGQRFSTFEPIAEGDAVSPMRHKKDLSL